MQESVRAGSEAKTRLYNPLLDLAIAISEAQLKAWQAYQVEGTRFVAKRLRANLELLRALGHCTDMTSIGECNRCWLSDLRQDYGEEWGRLVGTTCALSLADIAPMGWLFGRGASQMPSEASSQSRPGPQSQRQAA